MVNVIRDFKAGDIYHVFNRGVEKRTIFQDEIDYDRFLKRLLFYQQVLTPKRFSDSVFELHERKPPLHFQLFAYCLMPNHFHLLLQANSADGITRGASNLLNSYTRYFNTRHHRVGPLFQGMFKSVRVESDEQLLHVFRYIHLNPYVAGLEQKVGVYPWSSYGEFSSSSSYSLCHQEDFLQLTTINRFRLQEFTTDFADYSRSAKILKNLVFEED